MVRLAYIAFGVGIAALIAGLAVLAYNYSGGAAQATGFPKDLHLYIFGSIKCPHCAHFKKWLSSVYARYVFCDVYYRNKCALLFRNLTFRYKLPLAIPTTIAVLNLSNGKLFVFIVIGDLDNTAVWRALRPKTIGGMLQVPSIVYPNGKAKYMPLTPNSIPVYGSYGNYVEFDKWVHATPETIVRAYCAVAARIGS